MIGRLLPRKHHTERHERVLPHFIETPQNDTENLESEKRCCKLLLIELPETGHRNLQPILAVLFELCRDLRCAQAFHTLMEIEAQGKLIRVPQLAEPMLTIIKVITTTLKLEKKLVMLFSKCYNFWTATMNPRLD